MLKSSDQAEQNMCSVLLLHVSASLSMQTWSARLMLAG